MKGLAPGLFSTIRMREAKAPEQRHRAGSPVNQTAHAAAPGLQELRCTRILFSGIEVMQQVAKRQMKGCSLTRTELFYSLVTQVILIMSSILAPQSLLRQSLC